MDGLPVVMLKKINAVIGLAHVNDVSEINGYGGWRVIWG